MVCHDNCQLTKGQSQNDSMMRRFQVKSIGFVGFMSIAILSLYWPHIESIQNSVSPPAVAAAAAAALRVFMLCGSLTAFFECIYLFSGCGLRRGRQLDGSSAERLWRPGDEEQWPEKTIFPPRRAELKCDDCETVSAPHSLGMSDQFGVVEGRGGRRHHLRRRKQDWRWMINRERHIYIYFSSRCRSPRSEIHCKNRVQTSRIHRQNLLSPRAEKCNELSHWPF